MKYNRIASLDDYPQLKRAHRVWMRLRNATCGTWPALFKTKQHKRRLVRCRKVARLFVRRAEKEFGINYKDFAVKWLQKEVVIVWKEKS